MCVCGGGGGGESVYKYDGVGKYVLTKGDKNS